MLSISKAFQGRSRTAFRNLSEREIIFFSVLPQFEKNKMLTKGIGERKNCTHDKLALFLTQIWYFSQY